MITKTERQSVIYQVKKVYTETEAFLLVAMSTECYRHALETPILKEFIDDNGHAEFYELIMKIANDLLFDVNGEYHKWLNAKDQTDWFSKNHNTCMDWYHMDKAKELLNAEFLI